LINCHCHEGWFGGCEEGRGQDGDGEKLTENARPGREFEEKGKRFQLIDIKRMEIKEKRKQ